MGSETAGSTSGLMIKYIVMYVAAGLTRLILGMNLMLRGLTVGATGMLGIKMSAAADGTNVSGNLAGVNLFCHLGRLGAGRSIVVKASAGSTFGMVLGSVKVAAAVCTLNRIHVLANRAVIKQIHSRKNTKGHRQSGNNANKCNYKALTGLFLSLLFGKVNLVSRICRIRLVAMRATNNTRRNLFSATNTFHNKFLLCVIVLQSKQLFFNASCSLSDMLEEASKLMG